MRNALKTLMTIVFACALTLALGCPNGHYVPDDGDDTPGEPGRASAVWARHAGGPTSDVAYALDLTSEGASIVTGYFSSTAVFSSSTQLESAWASSGDNDVFIAKYTSDGELSWVTAAGGSGTDEGHGIAVLADGSFYVTGCYSLYASFGVRDPIQQVLPSAGLLDIFLAYYSNHGLFQFATRAGGISNDEANDLAALDNGSAFVTGYFSDQAAFGVRETNETVLIANGAEDLFVARYNDDGSLAWVKRAGGPDTDMGMGIAVYSDASCVAAGYINGQFKGDGGAAPSKALARDAYIVRYDGLGDRSWVREIGGSGDTVALDVAALPGGDCIVVGAFTGTVTFGNGEPTQTTLSAGNTMDAFFARFASDGDLVWVKQAQNIQGEVLPYTVSAYDDGTFVAGGYFTKRTVFGPDETAENEVEAVAGQDLFVAKFAEDGSVITVCHGGGDGDEMILGVVSASGEDYLEAGDDFVAAGTYDDPMIIGIDSSSSRSLTTTYGGWDILVSRLSE